MESLLKASARRFGVLGRAALLPVVLLVCAVYWGVRPWTLTVVSAAVAITLLAPAVAADLLPVALIGLAGMAFLLIRRDVALPPGSGTTDGYPGATRDLEALRHLPEPGRLARPGQVRPRPAAPGQSRS